MIQGTARDDWIQGGTFVAAGGELVGAYDDVTLLNSVPVVANGRGGPWEDVPADTTATVLFFTQAEPRQVDLECYIGDGFCFAHAAAQDVRLLRRASDKVQK